jgi:trimeric autotransporter adhesin
MVPDWQASCIIPSIMFRPTSATKETLALKGAIQMFTGTTVSAQPKRPWTSALFGAIVFVAVCALLVSTGCGGGSSNPITTAGANSTTISFGDAGSETVIAAEVTVTAITLNGGTNPSVLAKPTEIELTHNLATFEPLSLVSPPSGTYTGATLSFSNPEVVVVDPTTKAITKLTATLATSTVNVPFSPSITIGPGATVLNFDMNLASSISISGTTATVTPTFTVSTSTIAAGTEGSETEDDGELEDVRGTITNVASPKFTIQPAQTAQPITITTDANTKYADGVTSFANLTNGMIVSVDAATQTDGSILAKKVESETETATGEEVEGIITSVTCTVAAGCPAAANLATSIAITTHKVSATSAASAPATATTVNVPITTSTKFMVHSNISGSFPTFDASTISKAQRVEVDSENEAGNTSTSVGASKIKLQEQGISGTISALSGSNFTLTLDPTSAFASLTGQNTISVLGSGARLKNGVVLANGTVVKARGLLFFNGTSYTLIASRFSK